MGAGVQYCLHVCMPAYQSACLHDYVATGLCQHASVCNHEVGHALPIFVSHVPSHGGPVGSGVGMTETND